MNIFKNKFMYRVLVVSMISIILSFFLTNSVVEAKLKIADGEFYYTGTQDGEWVVQDSFWTRVISALKEVANYLLGALTLGFRMPVVGWIEIMEMLLTTILSLGEGFDDINVNGMDSYTQDTVNIETILFNRVPILDANIFKAIEEDEEE